MLATFMLRMCKSYKLAPVVQALDSAIHWINQQKGRLRDEMYFNSILKGSFFVMKHFGQSQELQKNGQGKLTI